MDDYQIPTTDGRHVTLRYDEQSRQAMISFPPAENEEQERSGFGFTPDDAEHFIAGLTAIQARMASGASGGVSAD
ncbi:MAG TPA: hypothetical protein VJT72_18375 [Pseudonocardiaceae bacterium]|nr:hypothetical protein [Pseudonocardiaceae bacterium]